MSLRAVPGHLSSQHPIPWLAVLSGSDFASSKIVL
jgi:hypothetical protein